jgi:hypothetical protein
VAHALAPDKTWLIASPTDSGDFPLALFDRVATDAVTLFATNAVTLLHPPIFCDNVRFHASGRTGANSVAAKNGM